MTDENAPRDAPADDLPATTAALRRYAQSLTRNVAEAEDLVQEALLRAHERRGSFRRGRALRPWLMAILHNSFIDRFRARRAEAAREADYAALIQPGHAPDGEERLRLAQVRALFLRLPEEQRAALHLVAIEDLSYAEAADVLGIPQGTLMSRLARARASLRGWEAGGPSGTEAPRRAHLQIVAGRRDRIGPEPGAPASRQGDPASGQDDPTSGQGDPTSGQGGAASRQGDPAFGRGGRDD